MAAKERPPLDQLRPRRIAIIKPSALGDIVHALPVLTALRQRFPTAHITWVVNRSYEGLLRGHPDLDDVLVFDRAAFRDDLMKAVLGYNDFFRKLGGLRCDLVVDLQGLFRSGVMTAATRAPRRLGLSSAREGATWFYTDVAPVVDFDALHAVERYWLTAAALGAGAGPKTFRLPASAAAEAWTDETLADCPRPYVVVGVGSRWMTKRWPVEHFATLIRKAQDRVGGTAVFVGGRDEDGLARQVARRLRSVTLNVTGRTNLPQLTAMLRRADVMVANDTGPLHLAAALGRPVVAPYTCTKIRLNGPFPSAAGAVEARVWCQGSYIKKCSRLDCMKELTPFRLWPALYEVLRSWENNCQSA